jgi:hypothetical protein
MRNTQDTHTLKAIARINEHEDMYIGCDESLFLLRSPTDYCEIAN